MIRCLTATAVCVGLMMAGSNAAGVRWNVSPSMALGLWTVQPLTGLVSRDVVVTLCLPPAAAKLGRERGYLAGGACPGNTELLLKTVVAVPGDAVTISDLGIAVNGKAVPQSQPLAHDDAGRAMRAVPPGIYHVARGEVWVIGTKDARSYDSRYYAGVPMTNLYGQATPLWVLR